MKMSREFETDENKPDRITPRWTTTLYFKGYQHRVHLHMFGLDINMITLTRLVSIEELRREK